MPNLEPKHLTLATLATIILSMASFVAIGETLFKATSKLVTISDVQAADHARIDALEKIAQENRSMIVEIQTNVRWLREDREIKGSLSTSKP